MIVSFTNEAGAIADLGIIYSNLNRVEFKDSENKHLPKVVDFIFKYSRDDIEALKRRGKRRRVFNPYLDTKRRKFDEFI